MFLNKTLQYDIQLNIMSFSAITEEPLSHIIIAWNHVPLTYNTRYQSTQLSILNDLLQYPNQYYYLNSEPLQQFSTSHSTLIISNIVTG